MTRQELEGKLFEIYELGQDIGNHITCEEQGLYSNWNKGAVDRRYKELQDLKNKVTILMQQTCDEVFSNG